MIDKELLYKEYFQLQSVVEEFDKKSLTIKAWSVSLAGVLATAKALSDNHEILLLSSILCLMFWFIDASWKTFQFSYYMRIREIENYMKGKIENIINLQITTSWSKSYHAGGIIQFLKILFWLHIILPHGIMFFLFLILYFIYYQHIPS